MHALFWLGKFEEFDIGLANVSINLHVRNLFLTGRKLEGHPIPSQLIAIQ